MIAGLATVDPECPLQFWSEMIPHFQHTLNLLRTLRRNNKLSAYENMNGKFDYNKTPLPMVGSQALTFLDPDNCNTFQLHRLDAFVVGRAPLHYRLLQFYVTITRGFVNTGKYKLYPAHCHLPTLSKANLTLLAAHEMLDTQKEAGTHSVKKIKHARILQ